jgi:hypothetical protein
MRQSQGAQSYYLTHSNRQHLGTQFGPSLTIVLPIHRCVINVSSIFTNFLTLDPSSSAPTTKSTLTTSPSVKKALIFPSSTSSSPTKLYSNKTLTPLSSRLRRRLSHKGSLNLNAGCPNILPCFKTHNSLPRLFKSAIVSELKPCVASEA